MAKLRLIAGAQAYQQLTQHGFKQELFSQLLAASGGPKWIVFNG